MALIRSGLSSFDFFETALYLPFEIFQAAVVLDHVVGESSFFLQAHLRVDVLLRRRLVEAIALLLTGRAADRHVARDQNHRAQAILADCLRKAAAPRTRSLVAGGCVLTNALLGQGAHARMDDRFELFCARRGC